MSIESEVLRIQKNVADAYAVVAEMGGNVPVATQLNSENLAAAVRTIPAGGSFPSGGIIIWSGTANNIPDGWALCDGDNGTPDLRGRFVLGSSNSYAVGSVGGEITHALTTEELPAHTHTNTTYVRSASGNNYCLSPLNTNSASVVATISTNSTGSNKPHNNMPPYYALCYIMKL